MLDSLEDQLRDYHYALGQVVQAYNLAAKDTLRVESALAGARRHRLATTLCQLPQVQRARLEVTFPSPTCFTKS